MGDPSTATPANWKQIATKEPDNIAIQENEMAKRTQQLVVQEEEVLTRMLDYKVNRIRCALGVTHEVHDDVLGEANRLLGIAPHTDESHIQQARKLFGLLGMQGCEELHDLA